MSFSFETSTTAALRPRAGLPRAGTQAQASLVSYKLASDQFLAYVDPQKSVKSDKVKATPRRLSRGATMKVLIALTLALAPRAYANGRLTR